VIRGQQERAHERATGMQRMVARELATGQGDVEVRVVGR